jgi:hypothetical protein
MAQRGHRRLQRIIPLATNISHLFQRHLTIEPITIPAACPLVLQSGGTPHLPSIGSGVVGNAAKLCSEGRLTPFKMNLLVLIMQLVMLSEYINSPKAFAGCYSPNKHADLNNCIWHQVM